MEYINNNVNNSNHLIKFLELYSIKDYYNEIIENVFNIQFNRYKSSKIGIIDWTKEQVNEWLLSIKFLGDNNVVTANKCLYEWIDGKCFMLLSLNDWISFNLNPLHFIGLSCIRKGWLEDWDSSNYQLNLLTTNALKNIDKIFGQLVVLGYTEYRSDKSNEPKKSIGSCNKKFILKSSEVNNKITFRIGRSDSKVINNDIVIHGNVHINQDGLLTGPISRYSCKIECGTDYPYKCHLYGSNLSDINGTSEVMIVSANDDDVVNKYGIKLYNPTLKQWFEISSKGNCFSIRQGRDQLGIRLASPYSNELIDGCIIDLYGTCVLFQSFDNMSKQQAINPMVILNEFNELKPQCPVLMHTLYFTYTNPIELKLKEINKLYQQGISYIPIGDIHIPSTEIINNDDGHRTHVFPSCGHVHGFHQSLLGKSCPLCRKPGVFVPILFPFETSICSKKPTHVFNPCGHVASKRTCQYWSNINMYLYNQLGEIIDSHACCPYCYTPLKNENNGGSYNRLILQTENGDIWERDNDSDEDISNKSISSNNLNQDSIVIQTYQPISYHSKDVNSNIEPAYIIDKSKLNI